MADWHSWPCRVPACEFTVHVKKSGLCRRHYLRLHFNGSLESSVQVRPHGMSRVEVLNRFSERPGVLACWEWTSTKNSLGYGAFSFKNAQHSAHRTAYEVNYGAIPEGVHVRHKCDNPACVNPLHLELGSHAENMADMATRGRAVRGEANHQSKLTDSDVAEMRREREGGATYTSLGERYSVSVATAWNAINGKTWRHVA